MAEKKFRWTEEMISGLISCLSDYKTKMEYQALDLDTDRNSQYKSIRSEMAKKFEEDLFGPEIVSEIIEGEFTKEQQKEQIKCLVGE